MAHLRDDILAVLRYCLYCRSPRHPAVYGPADCVTLYAVTKTAPDLPEKDTDVNLCDLGGVICRISLEIPGVQARTNSPAPLDFCRRVRRLVAHAVALPY